MVSVYLKLASFSGIWRIVLWVQTWKHTGRYNGCKGLICDCGKVNSSVVLELTSTAFLLDQAHDDTPFLKHLFFDPNFGQQSVGMCCCASCLNDSVEMSYKPALLLLFILWIGTGGGTSSVFKFLKIQSHEEWLCCRCSLLK